MIPPSFARAPREAGSAWWLLLAWPGLLLGCGPEEPPVGLFPERQGELDGGDRDVGREPVELAVPDGGEGSRPLRADGTWLLWNETVTCVDVLGLQLEGLTEAVYLVELEDEGGGQLLHRQRACYSTMTPILNLATAIPDELSASIPPLVYRAILEGSEPGAGYRGPLTVELWGVRLTDPYGEQLPTEPGDPRVFDMDGDGQPGATLILGDNFCEMHVVQRATKAWRGTVVSAHRIEGQGLSESEQNLLGATNGFCEARYGVRYMNDRHRFVLLRVDGRDGAPDLDQDGDGQIDCDEARTFGLATFQPRTVDNQRCR